jgi:hypothetical protein
VTRTVRCQMRTRPGMYAQYDGHVDVVADPSDPEDVFRAAVRRLKATAFPDYPSSAWKMESYEVRS